MAEPGCCNTGALTISSRLLPSTDRRHYKRPGHDESSIVPGEEDQRFIVLTFKEPAGKAKLVTFTVPILQNYRAPCPDG